MALQVGELLALLNVDTRGYNRGLQQAEQTLRAADTRMAAEAERAGQATGQALGDGMEREARQAGDDAADAAGRALRSGLPDDAGQAGREAGVELEDGLTSGARQAGEQAGQAAGDGLTDASEQGAERATGGILDKLGGLKAGVIGVGAAAGALLMGAFSEAMDQQQINAKLSAQLGATPAQSKRYGQAAGELFTRGFVDNYQEGADTIRASASAGLIPPDATIGQLTSISSKVADVANAFNLDLGDTAVAVGQLMRNGLAPDANTALDMIAEGLRGTDKRADDLLETITEYSPKFKEAGLSGKTSLGLLRQGLKAGAKDTDKIADAMKELQLQVTSGGSAQMAALESLHLNSKQVADDMAAGGKRGEHAMDQVLDKLREVGPNSTTAKQAVQTLFGGPGEDLGAALFALDVDKASKSMDGAAGSTKRLGDQLHDTAANRVERFKRGLQQNVVDFLGATVIPALTDFGTYMGDTFGKIWDDAGKDADGFGERVANFMSTAGGKIAEVILTEWIPNAVNALPMLGVKMAEYFMNDPVAALKIAAIAGAIVLGLMYLPEILIGSLAAVAGLILGGLVEKLIAATTEKLPLWWDAFKSWVLEKAGQAGAVMDSIGSAISDWFGGLWDRYIAGPTSRAWASWVRYVQGIPGRTVSALGALGTRITEVARNAWQRFRDGAVAKVSGFVTWVKGIPGRVKSALGDAGSMLYSAGRDIVVGLWNGIKSTGSWLWSTLTHWALSQIPAPIAKALGIGSPSKLMADEVGKWIPAGVVEGIEAGQGAVDDAMSSLVSTPAIGSPMVGATGGAGGRAGAGGAANGVTVVRLELAGPREMQSLIRGIVADAGGNVQVAFGRQGK